MKLEIQREQLLGLLQNVVGVVERRQTLPILANVLLVAENNRLVLNATDLEVELAANQELAFTDGGKTTLPARKLLEILRALPEGETVLLTVTENKAVLRCGRSRFSLATLPAEEFPSLEAFNSETSLRLSKACLKNLIDHTQFAMAQQDVRYYLNGLLLELSNKRLLAVATDGHRLALSEQEVAAQDDGEGERQVIVPRKGIQELARLLAEDDKEIELKMSSNHIHIDLGDIVFTSKLIDGRFPDYRRAVPPEGERVVVADRLLLRNALARTAILSNENRGVRLQLQENLLRLQANNPEQEEAEEEIEISYTGEALEIGFNVTYLLDALGALSGDLVKLFFTDAATSCLLRAADDDSSRYVVSPMRL